MASWLANLDEDWVSEGPSAPSSPAPGASSPSSTTLRVVPNLLNVQNYSSKSRIPRLKGAKEDAGLCSSRNNPVSSKMAQTTSQNSVQYGQGVPVSRTSTISTQNSIGTQIHHDSALVNKDTGKGLCDGLSVFDQAERPVVPYALYHDANLKRTIADLVITGGHIQDLFSPIHLERIFNPVIAIKQRGPINSSSKLSSTPSRPQPLTPESPRNGANLDDTAESTPPRLPSSDFVDSLTTDCGEVEDVAPKRPHLYEGDETLPLATSTVRRMPTKNTIGTPSSEYSYDNSFTVSHEQANEKFSPVTLGSDGKSGRTGEPVQKAGVGTDALSLSATSLMLSPPNIILSSKPVQHSSKLEQGTSKSGIIIQHEALTPPKRSAKRTSMGNAKSQSPGLALCQKHQFVSGRTTNTPSNEVPSSPLQERTPKRVRLSTLSDCIDLPNSKAMARPELKGEASTEVPPKGLGSLTGSESPGAFKSEEASCMGEDSGSDASHHEETGDSDLFGGEASHPQVERDWRASMAQSVQFHMTGPASLKTIPLASVSNILPKKIGQMVFDEKQLRWIKAQTYLQREGILGASGTEEISVIGTIDDTILDEDPLKDISDLSVDYSLEQGTVVDSGSLASKRREGLSQGNRVSEGRRGTAGNGGHMVTKAPHAQGQNASPKDLASLDRDAIALGIRLRSERDQRHPDNSTKNGGHLDNRRADDGTGGSGSSEAEESLSGEQSDSVISRDFSYERFLQNRNHSPAYDYSSALAIEHDFYTKTRQRFRSADTSIPSATTSSASQHSTATCLSSTSRRHPSRGVPETPVQGAITPSLQLQNKNNTSYDRHRNFGKPLVPSSHATGRVSSVSSQSIRCFNTHNGSSITNRQLFLSPFRPEKLKSIRSEIPPHSDAKNKEVSFFNTPLPEISYHYLDAESAMNLEISYVAKFRGDTTRQRALISFSAATNTLVKHLTDIEPYEPYWEYTKQLRLADKELVTLHTLNEFCPRIEDLDVRGNKLGQVTGVPLTVRDLNVSRNRLTALTAWGHLVNLQYLDVSGNDLDSLSGFKHLIHLRELRVDNNQITDIADVFDLDGLISFSARKNRIHTVDFDGANLKRLETIDLKDNEIENIMNFDRLPNLSSLNLDNNKLRNLGLSPGEIAECLRTLKLNGNFLETLDIATIPNIRVLYLDNNRIEKIDNLHFAKHLDSFSIRQQNLETPSIPFDEVQEVRKLYISGNRLSKFSLRHDFPNLQYLEIAFSQLTSLPREFGMMMSNVRVLNLNCNAIADLKPLYGIMRLKKLALAGNRLSSLRKVSYMLKHFPTLRELDLRFNPLTVGFYSHLPSPDVEGRTVPNVSPVEDIGALDDAFKLKIDTRTAIQRRCYEIVIGEHCPKLKNLDGLGFSAPRTLQKDSIWKQMEILGIVTSSRREKEVQ